LAWLGPRLRGFKSGETHALDDPVMSRIERDLTPHFDVDRMMRFAQVEAADEAGQGP
jgi:hypothetical protein